MAGGGGRILVIDTATPVCSVAFLAADGAIIRALHEEIGRGHAERLMPMIAEVLAGERPDAIAVDCGPGSFTGVRVGLAAAKALGLAWVVPVSGFSSLALIAAAARAGSVAAAIPGGHGEVFVQRFAGDPPVAVEGLRSLAPEAAAATISEHLIVGTGAAAIVAARGTGEARPAFPNAVDYLGLGARDRSLPAQPIYGRAPDATPAAERR